MRTFKFLAQGARGPFSGQLWTADWRSTQGALVLGRSGFHVCRATDLAFWLHDELWETDIDGTQLASADCIVAERARLVRRISLWDKAGALRFADACIAHASTKAVNREYLADAKNAAQYGYPAVAAYSAALATADLRDERIWQSAWLSQEIIGDA